MSDNKKDILLVLQSRSNPTGLRETIQMCLNTCSSSENFEISCFIDDDQIELYQDVKTIFPQIHLFHTPHVPGNWDNTLKAQLNVIRSFDCDFVWRLPDDIQGLEKNWDAAIISNKSAFKDEIFTLFGTRNRNPHLCANAYSICEDINHAKYDMLRFGECLPIWTKKWAEYVMPLLIDTGYSAQAELMTMALVFYLKHNYGFTRTVGCNANYAVVVSSGNTDRFLDKGGRARDEAFFHLLTPESYDFFRATLDEMASQIRLFSAIEFFHENGYLVVNGIFTEEDADMSNRLIRRHANNDFAAIVNPDRYEDLIEQDERPKSNITLEEIEETANHFLSVMKNPNLVSMLENLSGKEMVGLSSQFIFKEAHSKYANQAWNIHQDGWYPNDKNGDYMTANWFLRNSDVENGTIFVYPGSHKLGLLSADPQKSFREDYDKNPGSECELPAEFEGKKVDVIIPKSGVVFLHGHCVHGSYSNKSDRSRPWHSCCYIAKGAPYVIGANAKRREIPLR